jgi:hypothetical protein
MYTVALIVLIGIASHLVMTFVTDFIPLNKIPFIGKTDTVYALTCIGAVWLTDTSILGTFGIGSTQQWVDVVGSGLAIAAASVLTESVTNYLNK